MAQYIFLANIYFFNTVPFYSNENFFEPNPFFAQKKILSTFRRVPNTIIFAIVKRLLYLFNSILINVYEKITRDREGSD